MIKAIKGDGNPEMEVKRFYTGVEIFSDCPECGKEQVFDGNDEYLSYGGTGLNTVHFFCCDECDYPECDGCGHEWDEMVCITLKVEPRTDA